MGSSNIPVIYILSNGRSGSTLLDLLLGWHSNVWTLGEAQILPWELRENRAPCGCGLPVARCDFWSRILPEIPLNIGRYPIKYFRERHGGGRVLRWHHLPGLLRGRVGDRWRSAVDEYGQINTQYFDEVRQEAERRREHNIQWLVDSSKDPYRLFWLHHSKRFNLRVIHLVKDPRAFVHSMTKPKYPIHKVVRFTARWIIENLLFLRLCQINFSHEQVYQLRYEDLASQSAIVLQRMGNWLDLQSLPAASDNFRKYTNHAISGGRMRWEKSKVYLDKSWESSLPRIYARFIYAFTSPVRGLLGY